jgi:gamma-glutamylcyclotransferase (GGCT)/AIG2-like uncharacterized protein YtfP
MSRKEKLVNRTIISLIEEEEFPVVKKKRVHCEIIEIDNDNANKEIDSTGIIDHNNRQDMQNSTNKFPKDESKFTKYSLGKTKFRSSLFYLQ